MQKVFVYYNDGYYSDGDVGISVFESRKDAQEFIQHRMSIDPSRKLDNYMVIEGMKMHLTTVEVVKKVMIANCA